MTEVRELTKRASTWLPPAGPRTLAVLRIAVGYFAFRSSFGFQNHVAPPEQLRVPPPGTAWLDFLPVNEGVFTFVAIVGSAAAILLILGWRPAWTASAAAVAVFYIGWVSTLTGKVDHNHHVLWTLVVLAISPCANAWSIRREDRAGSYQWPALAVMAMIGLIYFGAGLQKVTSAGLEWGWSDNLTNIMLNQAWEKGHDPIQWLVDFPVASRVLGTGALLFELLFLPLILYPRTRRWIWPAGLLFHWGTWLILGISFISLQALYVVFIRWDGPGDSSPPTDWQRRVLIGLVAVVAVFAVLGVERVWPVAAYPGFDGIHYHLARDYQMVIDGETVFLTDGPLPMPPWHVVPLIGGNLRQGRVPELLEWLGADELYEVTIDSKTGEIFERTKLG